MYMCMCIFILSCIDLNMYMLLFSIGHSVRSKYQTDTTNVNYILLILNT